MTGALHERTVAHLQRSVGNAAVQNALAGTGIGTRTDAHGPVQRQLTVQRASDLMDALILEDWPVAVSLLSELSDAELAARIADESPERLLRMQRAAVQARATRVVQAITNVRIRSGTQVANVEGTRFSTPVTLFQNGVVLSKDIRFVKRGRFRSDDDFELFKNRVINSVRMNLTARFRLRISTPAGAPQPGDGEYTIRVIIIDNPAASYRMNLYGQRHGRAGVTSTTGRLYELGMAGETEESDTTIAHECAHILLGAHDEYADASAPARQLFTDHSLMGDYTREGEQRAELKARHFGDLVRLVSGWFPRRDISIVQ